MDEGDTITVRARSAATPDWRLITGGLVLCAAAILFGAEITAIQQINDWWLDEAFSLFVSATHSC